MIISINVDLKDGFSPLHTTNRYKISADLKNKIMIVEIRKLIVTWLMNLTFWIIPDGEFKKQYANFMILWIREL